MNSINEIPDSWETKNAETVTVNPHTGEVEPNVSSSGAGPQVQQVRGTIVSKPCGDCDSPMALDTNTGELVCESCENTESSRIHDHDM